MNVERVVLRAAVGHDNYAQIEKVAVGLDELEARGVIGPEGLEALVSLLAVEIVARAALRESLSTDGELIDTLTPEDSHE